MRLRKTGWAVWDKNYQKFLTYNGMIIFSDRTKAWLNAQKERKGSPYKLIKVSIATKSS